MECETRERWNHLTMFEPPFTDAHYHGISSFLPDQAEEIVSRIESINATAMVT